MDAIDNPVLKRTPGGWMAEATDSPLIAVVASTEAEAVDLFRTRRAVWRELMAQAAADQETTGILSDPEAMAELAAADEAIAGGDVVRGTEAVRALRPRIPGTGAS